MTITQTAAAEAAAENGKRRRFLVPRFVHEQLQQFRAIGFKAYLKGNGKWIFAAIVLFYLIRDVSLYIIVPYLLVSGLISCPGPASG